MRAVGRRRAVLRRARRGRVPRGRRRASGYVDWVQSWGPLIFGHADPETVEAVIEAARDGTSFGAPTEREVELAAEIVDAFPSIELVRLVSSGTEAAMSAIRARARVHAARPDPQVRGRLPRPRRRAARRGGLRAGDARHPRERRRARPALRRTRSSRPTTTSMRAAAAVERYGEGLAAIIVEPVAGNMGVVPPGAGLPRGAARARATHRARCSSSTR